MEVEMQDLSKKPRTSANDHAPLSQEDHTLPPVAIQTFTVWSYATATWFFLLSSLFLFFPRFLLFISCNAATTGECRDSLTALERYLVTHCGILFMATSAAFLFSIPHDHPVRPRDESATPPLLWPMTCGLLLSAFFSYNTPELGSLPLIMFSGAGIVGLWGLWALLFASTARISRKTGADKHTSSFMFGNKSAASKQKAAWKREQRKEL